MHQKIDRISWMDHLRGFITILVVAHHSSLAYTTFAYFNKDAYILSTHPVTDSSRWRGMDIFEDFNDIFFMSLMFLISGIFVMKSIEGKGRKLFIRDRFYRLIIPFTVGVTVLMLLAYYPAYLLAHGNNDIGAYVIDFFTVEAWPVGPPWFIWLLFAFNLLFACLYPFTKKIPGKAAPLLASLKQHPVKLLFTWYIITWILYIPLLLWFGPDRWTGIGPFDFQLSRVLLYFGYFVLGALLGSTGLQYGLFSEGSLLIKKWPVWLTGCLLTYALLKLSEAPLIKLLGQQKANLLLITVIYRSAWVLSCTVSCIALLTLFRHFFQRSTKWWRSLSANAYGIYLIHYIFVIWCQYLLLGVNFPVVIKFLLTFVASVIASWWLTHILRKNKTARKYL